MNKDKLQEMERISKEMEAAIKEAENSNPFDLSKEGVFFEIENKEKSISERVNDLKKSLFMEKGLWDKA